MKINVNSNRKNLGELLFGEVFIATTDDTHTPYMVTDGDYSNMEEDERLCVSLVSGRLYCFENTMEVTVVKNVELSYDFLM
jgi:hypothetical protein